MFPRHRAIAVLLSSLVLAPPITAHAWGSTGHRLIGVCAIKALPAEFPAFLRDPWWGIGESDRPIMEGQCD